MEDHDSTQRFEAKKLASVPMIESNGVALPNGTHIGNFSIEKVLGIGGFGIVYLAIQDVVGRKVAIKEFFPSVMVDRVEGQTVKLRATNDLSLFDSGMSSFVKEATILSSLNHPSLVQVLHFWQENGTAYMVMPYYEGQALADTIKDKEFVVTAGFINKLLEGLLPALEYLHQQNIYHRDISPENIFLLKNGNPMLLDFGAARQIVEEGMNVTAMLKPSYAPIEQYDKTAKQGAYTDIYALCATLYHLITKKQPQASVTRSLNNYMAVLSNDEILLGQYPLGLLQAIDAGLEVMPDKRPQTIVDWRQILQSQKSNHSEAQQKDHIQFSEENPITRDKDLEPNIVVMNQVQKKGNKKGVLLLAFVLMAGALAGYYILNKKNAPLSMGDVDIVSYNQVMEQYTKINNLASDIDSKRIQDDLLGLKGQLKSFTPPQIALDIKKKMLVLEQEKISIDEMRKMFLKENISIWEKVNVQVKTMTELKAKNKFTELKQLADVVAPVMSQMEAKLVEYKNTQEASNKNTLQKINGKWALTSCSKDASSWQVQNNMIHVSVDNRQVASEEVIFVGNHTVFTIGQQAGSYPKNINELFFEYHVADSMLEIKHLSDRQKLKRCL